MYSEAVITKVDTMTIRVIHVHTSLLINITKPKITRRKVTTMMTKVIEEVEAVEEAAEVAEEDMILRKEETNLIMIMMSQAKTLTTGAHTLIIQISHMAEVVDISKINLSNLSLVEKILTLIRVVSELLKHSNNLPRVAAIRKREMIRER